MTAKLTAPPQFTTTRLLLRKPCLEDAPVIFHGYARDPEVVRYLTWRTHGTVAETGAYLRHCLEEWARGASYPFVIEELGQAGQPVGMIHLHEGPGRVTFGYVLAQPSWGRGYMTEALTTLVDWALAQPQVWRAAAFCDIDNQASARVMEKAGMSFEGVLRRYSLHPAIATEPRDCRMFAKVKS